MIKINLLSREMRLPCEIVSNTTVSSVHFQLLLFVASVSVKYNVFSSFQYISDGLT